MERTNKLLKTNEFDQSLRSAKIVKSFEEENVEKKINDTKIIRDVNTSQLDQSMSA